MPYAHQLHPLAHRDIIEAYIWYEDQKVGLGETFIQAIQDKIEAILKNPSYYGSKSSIGF